MPQFAIFLKNGDGGVSYLTTYILPLREIMPHYGIFVKIGDGAISYLINSTLPLREFMVNYEIFVLIGVGGHKLSGHIFSASSRNYASLRYICHDCGRGYRLSDHFYSALRKLMLQYGIFVKNGDGVKVI